MAFSVVRAIKVTGLARFAASGNNKTHKVRVLSVRNSSGSGNSSHGAMQPTSAVSVVAEATIDFGVIDRLVDSSGFVHSQLLQPAVLAPGLQYYLVSSEAHGGDIFYSTAAVQPCAGDIGAGGTLPRMRVLTDAVVVDGGVSTADVTMGTGWTMLTDWEPRSHGPVTFSFTESF